MTAPTVPPVSPTMTSGFQIRCPWYARDEGEFGLRDARSLRPHIQMYAGADYVTRLIKDPTVYLTPDKTVDYWNYPVPSKPIGPGRSALSSYQMVTTDMRKLFQANHDRFYAVVVEVFCDQPGLPRAGEHDDIALTFAMRRRRVSYSDDHRSVRKLATTLVTTTAKNQHLAVRTSRRTSEIDPDRDVRQFWWTDQAVQAFAAENRHLIDAARPRGHREAWVVGSDGRGAWVDCDGAGPLPGEQTFGMWRLPRRDGDCLAVESRSLWFGVVPTYSSDHGMCRPPHHKGKQKGPQYGPKLDEYGIYELVCFVTQKPARGHEHCPPKVWWSAPSEPFRLASPMDPDGTSNRSISISAPDFRMLAARVGRKGSATGPGGLRIVTPPNSQMVFNPFGKPGAPGPPGAGEGRIGSGGGICLFAFELFFIVALFLFLMFLPIVVLAFQLWWMLALRFCIPPSVSFGALAQLTAGASITTDAQLQVDVAFGAMLESDAAAQPPPDRIWYPQIDKAVAAANAASPAPVPPLTTAGTVHDLVLVTDPRGGRMDPEQPAGTSSREDPLCGS